jgi:hypothetical protein
VSKPSFSLLAVLLLALSSFAQQPDSQQQPEPSAPLTVVKARSDLVLVPVVVKDKKGKYIAGLAKDAFQLEENGKPQTLSLFEEVQPPAETATPAAAVDLGYSNLPFDKKLGTRRRRYARRSRPLSSRTRHRLPRCLPYALPDRG